MKKFMSLSLLLMLGVSSSFASTWDLYENSFKQGCVPPHLKSNQKLIKYCDCTWKGMKKNVTLQQMNSLNNVKDPNDPKVVNLMNQVKKSASECTNLLK